MNMLDKRADEKLKPKKKYKDCMFMSHRNIVDFFEDVNLNNMINFKFILKTMVGRMPYTFKRKDFEKALEEVMKEMELS